MLLCQVRFPVGPGKCRVLPGALKFLRCASVLLIWGHQQVHFQPPLQATSPPAPRVCCLPDPFVGALLVGSRQTMTRLLSNLAAHKHKRMPSSEPLPRISKPAIGALVWRCFEAWRSCDLHSCQNGFAVSIRALGDQLPCLKNSLSIQPTYR